jgi:hypothetical protein
MCKSVLTYLVQVINYIIYKLHIFRPTNYKLHHIPKRCYVTYSFLWIAINIFIDSHSLCRLKWFSHHCGRWVVWLVLWSHLKDTDRNLELETEGKILLKRIVKDYVEKFSELQRRAILRPLLFVKQISVFIMPPSSNTSTWPTFQ